MLNDNSKEKRFGQQTSHDASNVGNHIIDTAVTPEAAPDPFQTEPPSSQNEEGRFRFLRPLAEGNLGIVSVALDTELNREIALKRIRHDLASKADYLERFAREAEVTGALEHPGVVPVYGYGIDVVYK